MKRLGFWVVLIVVAAGHFYNANLQAHELEINEPIEQIEEIIKNRHGIKKKWKNFFRYSKLNRFKINFHPVYA